MNVLKFIIGSSLLSLMCGCARERTDGKTLTVSIEPLRYVVEQIAGHDFRVQVLVPSGASPETFEPTPTQLREVAGSEAFVAIGLLDFEKPLMRSIEANMPDVKIVNVSDHMELIGSGSDHVHAENGDGHATKPDIDHVNMGKGSVAVGHHDGVDPHIWLSTSRLKIIAENVYRFLSSRYPDSTRYRSNYEALCGRIDSVQHVLSGLFAHGRRSFIIFHPALSYFSEDYGLNQIALEYEGKEPSVAYLSSMIDTAQRLNVGKVLYQREFSRNTVDAVVKELGVPAVEIDPLAANVLDEMIKLGNLIAK